MLGLNWISDAVYRLRQSGDRNFDRRLGVDTCEIELKTNAGALGPKLQSHALHYAPTSIALFRRIVRLANVDQRDFAFIDLGAGKGRTLLLASCMGFDPVIGVEIDPRLCRIAGWNIERLEHRGGVLPMIIEDDARRVPLPQGNIFVFMFNPFTGAIFADMAARLAELARERPRAVVIAYHNHSCADELDRTGAFRRVRMRRIMFWKPPTVSLFYNEEAWGRRRASWRRLCPRCA